MKKIKKTKLLKTFLVTLSLTASLFIVDSCTSDPSLHGKITPYNGSKNSFSFSVDEQYLEKNQNSKKSQEHPQMTEAEDKLLTKLLKKQNYCKSNKGTDFVITSRQEKIYDVTFSHLIAQNYKAKPVAPRTYYGECR